jgi:hypothetical protein
LKKKLRNKNNKKKKKKKSLVHFNLKKKKKKTSVRSPRKAHTLGPANSFLYVFLLSCALALFGNN